MIRFSNCPPPALAHHGSGWLALNSVFPLVVCSVLLTLSACGTGSDETDPSSNPAASEQLSASTPSTEAEDATVTPETRPNEQTPVPEDPQNDASSSENAPSAESSPIELLMNEIKLAAASPIILLNEKLRNGDTLEDYENDCLGNFDPAFGEQATSIDCETAVPVHQSITQALFAVLQDTAGCQAALAASSAVNCTLESAELNIPVEWVANDSSTPSQIGSASPITGARIRYNINNSGQLEISSNSNLAGQFKCLIEIASASFADDETNVGNCRAEVDKLISRLFGFRQAQS